MTKGRQNNAAELADLEMQVRKARQLVHQSELKVEAIEASIHEIEKFHPEIKIINGPARLDRLSGDAFSFFADKALLKTA